jgi:hypothetical protein
MPLAEGEHLERVFLHRERVEVPRLAEQLAAEVDERLDSFREGRCRPRAASCSVTAVTETGRPAESTCCGADAKKRLIDGSSQCLHVLCAVLACAELACAGLQGEDRKVRVLVVTGGHDFEVPAFERLFAVDPGVEA